MLISQTLWHAFKSRQIRIPPYAPLIDELVSARIIERRYGWRVDHDSGGFSDHIIALGLALVAAIGERGQVVVQDSRLQYALDRLLATIVYKRKWGLASSKTVGLTAFNMTAPPPDECWYALLRVVQILRHMDRMGEAEAGPIYDAIREAVRWDPHLLHGIVDGLAPTLGYVSDALTEDAA